MGKGIVITGATGAIGMALIKKCIQTDTKALILCHRGSARNRQIPESPLLKVVESDLDEMCASFREKGGVNFREDNADDRELDGFCAEGYDRFYHLAWAGTYGEGRNDLSLQTDNIRYTLDAVKLAKKLGCDTFVGVGSQAEYGRVSGKLSPDTPAMPENGYGIAKLCAGQMSRVLCGRLGLKHVWARVLSVYGPFDRPDSLVSASLRRMLAGETTAFTPGEQIWDFLYSGDAAQALWLLGERGKDGRVYCLGSGRGMPLKEYIRIMSELTGYTGKIGLGEIPYAEGQVMELCADITGLKEDAGYEPKTDFETGIRETIEWMNGMGD